VIWDLVGFVFDRKGFKGKECIFLSFGDIVSGIEERLRDDA
jgi:hypothetical protein